MSNSPRRDRSPARQEAKKQGLLDRIDLGEDIDILLGAAAAAVAGTELFKAASARKHKGRHLVGAAVGAGVALGAYKLYQHDKVEADRVEEAKHTHRHRQHAQHRDRPDSRQGDGYDDYYERGRPRDDDDDGDNGRGLGWGPSSGDREGLGRTQSVPRLGRSGSYPAARDGFGGWTTEDLTAYDKGRRPPSRRRLDYSPGRRDW